MRKFFQKTKTFLLDLFFPMFCLNCGKEGDWLCHDCFSLIEIFDKLYCPFCEPQKETLNGETCPSCKRTKTLKKLFCAASYDNFIIKKLINQFKYGDIRDLSKPLAKIITSHLANTEKNFSFSDFFIMPIPLSKRKIRFRGFNQAEELAEEISEILKIPILKNGLIKIKDTPSQTELKKEERIKNIQNVFYCPNPELVKNKKILLIDDVFTTGSTMEECAKTLKSSGAAEIWGMTVARG